MIKKLLPVLLTFLILIGITGCGSNAAGNDLIGKWTRDDQKDTITFDSEGNFSSSNMWSSGTYSVEGNTLSIETARSKVFTYSISEDEEQIALILQTDLNTFTYYKQD